MSTAASVINIRTPLPLLGPAIIVWVAFVAAASIKELVPYIHWFGSLPILIGLFLVRGEVRWKPLRVHFLFSALLVFSIVLVAFNSLTPDYELIQACKLALVLLVFVPAFVAKNQTSQYLAWGAEATSLVNISVVIAGLAGVTGLFSMMATARFGTVLNAPGTLWRAGVLALLWSLLQLVFHKVSIRYLAVFLSSGALMVLDGSRTAYLLIGVGAIFLVVVAILEPGSRGLSVIRKMVGAGVVAVLCAVLVITVAVQGELELGFLDRGAEFLSFATKLGVAGLRSADDVRAGALERVLQAISTQPFIGEGMGTTKSQSPEGPMVVHLSYLQIWADVGILGFFGYLGIHISAISLAWTRFRKRASYELSQRLSIYSAIYLLLVWMVAGLFHPVTTEISEWILFLTAVTMLHSPPSFSVTYGDLR